MPVLPDQEMGRRMGGPAGKVEAGEILKEVTMIELSKNDIQAIANDRFNRRYWKHLVGYLIAVIALLVGLGMAAPMTWPTAARICLMVPALLMYIFGALWWIRSSNKAGKALADACQSDTIVYKPPEDKKA